MPYHKSLSEFFKESEGHCIDWCWFSQHSVFILRRTIDGSLY